MESRSVSRWLGLIATAIGFSITFSLQAVGATEGRVLRIRRGVDGQRSTLLYGDFRGQAEIRGAQTGANDLASETTVELKGGARLFGMREFTIRAASDARGDAPVFEELRRAGVLAPRQVAVQVAVGDGAAAERYVEEGFSKELVESQQRRDGVLFRFDPSALPELRVVPFRERKVRKSKKRRAQLETAEGLLAGFLNGDLSTADAFDLDVLATFLAVAEVHAADAMLALPNLRFYFNPVIARIEPIGHRGAPALGVQPDSWVTTKAPWSARLLEDSRLLARFEQQLRDVAHATVRTGNLAARETVRARAFEKNTLPKFKAIEPALFADAEATSLLTNPIPHTSLAEVLAQHPFLEWTESRNVFTVRPGEWTVSGSLILPEGIGLELSAGTTLQFESDAMLLATGPLRFSGSTQAPVQLGPADGTSWQGVVVLVSSEPHRWEHVIVRQANGIDRDAWNLTGGVTFRASEVEITDSRIDGSRAEDALNLIRSRFSFSNLSISRAASDAFDCDFCRGVIRGGRIEQVGGDGIDVSGSEIRVVGVHLEEIRDKALSVGEASQLSARELAIDKVGTAAASKDGSQLVIETSEISGVGQVALMAYTKKAEYGPARLEARALSLDGIERRFAVQHGSHLSIDGAVQATEALDVDLLYRAGPMKKGPIENIPMDTGRANR